MTKNDAFCLALLVQGDADCPDDRGGNFSVRLSRQGVDLILLDNGWKVIRWADGAEVMVSKKEK